MGRPRSGCARCGGPQRHPIIVGNCGKCGAALCQKHIVWDPDESRFICTKCERERKKR